MICNMLKVRGRLKYWMRHKSKISRKFVINQLQISHLSVSLPQAPFVFSFRNASSLFRYVPSKSANPFLNKKETKPHLAKVDLECLPATNQFSVKVTHLPASEIDVRGHQTIFWQTTFDCVNTKYTHYLSTRLHKLMRTVNLFHARFNQQQIGSC